jgi:hypothetical protein
MFTTTLLTLALATLSTALPTSTLLKARAAGITDAQILNYALTLEHLEDKFYREGLANYTQQMFIDAGFPDPFYANLKEISYDETTHVSFLTKASQQQTTPPSQNARTDSPARTRRALSPSPLCLKA